MGSYWRSTRALLSCSLRVDICNCCFVLLGEINDDDDDDDKITDSQFNHSS